MRNANGAPPSWALAIISAAMDQLWARLKASPDSYVMNSDEFSLFNYYRTRYQSATDAPIARKATARYWNNHTGMNGT